VFRARSTRRPRSGPAAQRLRDRRPCSEKWPGVSIPTSLVRREGEGPRRPGRVRPGPGAPEGDAAMRFMLIVKATKESEAGIPPTKELITAMGAFNEEMVKAGIMLAGEGLQPSSKGARAKFVAGKRPVVTDGPFTETKELIAGFWVIQV